MRSLAASPVTYFLFAVTIGPNHLRFNPCDCMGASLYHEVRLLTAENMPGVLTMKFWDPRT